MDALAAAQPAWEAFRSRPLWQQLIGAGGAYVAAKEVGGALTERSLRGETCVITGAGQGMGRCMALMLAGEGCRLALWDVDKAAVDAVAAECSAKTEARGYRVDVTDRAAVRDAGERTLADFGGRVDILINNAGIVSGKELLDPTFDETRAAKTIDVNTTALIWCTRAFLPSMVKHNHGHIVTMASQAGLIGIPGMADYCASKWGAIGFHESLYLEVRKAGADVHMTCVCPGAVDTGMFKGVGLPGFMDLVLPLLTTEYAASRIVTAIKRRQQARSTP